MEVSRLSCSIRRSLTGYVLKDLTGCIHGTSAWIFNKAEDDAYMAKQRREEIETMKREAAEELQRLTERTRGVGRESPADEAGRG